MNPLITTLKEAKLMMRSIAFLVIFFHTFLILSPAAAAMRDEINKEGNSPLSDESQLSEYYIEAIENLVQLKQLRNEGKDTDAVLGELKTLQTQIEALNETVTENFTIAEAVLLEKQLPEVIVKRHNKMATQFTSKNKAFMALLNKETKTNLLSDIARGIHNFIDGEEVKPDQTISTTSVSDGKFVFKTSDFKRSQQAFDPNNLGTNSRRPDKSNTPKINKQQFIDNGFLNSPRMTSAALGDFTFSGLEDADNPLYLAATDEVQLTQSIKDKAVELDHDAVKIYHWVRNNIEWLPSWGAIQDAELTLEAKRGNAMDIASLTISLLRASQIPARYVHGTIDVPPEDFKNWAGGFNTKEAAGDYASSAGIPLTLQTTNYADGTSVKTMRLEHIWVEAATDFQPSRGAVNQDADTWVQLDPSFKQYEYQEGLDVVAISGLDMDQLAQDFVDSGTVNEAEGWATGFDPSILQNAQTQAQEKLEAHIATLDNPTVGDVIGGKKTIIKEYPALPSSLPNRIVVVGTRYDKLPSALQQTIEFAFARDILGDIIDPITFPFAKLNNEKVNLSFKPATQADEDALAALIPDNISDVNQLPTSLSSSIRVIPELKVNGEVVKTGASMGLGYELPFVTGIRFAGKGYIRTPREYKVVAGSFLNVNVFAGSVSPVKLEKLQEKLKATKTTLESADQTEIAALTRDDILGDMFYAGGLGYYAQLLSLSYISGLKAKGYYQLAAGYGTVGYEPEVNSFFGQPRGIKTGGVAFDIPMIHITANQDGDAEKARQFTLQIGTLSSALEHITPEQMFAPTDPNAPKPDAISAVKALQKASAAGQKIYQINQANMGQILPLLNHDQASKDEIRRALNAGKDVTTHTDKVSIPGGWSGFGYIITDPVVGDGVYKISGGLNGGEIEVKDAVTGILAVKDIFEISSEKSKFVVASSIVSSINGIVGDQFMRKMQDSVTTLSNSSSPYCLTASQGGAISVALTQLQGMGGEAIFSLSKPVLLLGQMIALTYIAILILHFIKMNQALGECGNVMYFPVRKRFFSRVV